MISVREAALKDLVRSIIFHIRERSKMEVFEKDVNIHLAGRWC
jgi:hypothetical protein